MSTGEHKWSCSVISGHRSLCRFFIIDVVIDVMVEYSQLKGSWKFKVKSISDGTRPWFIRGRGLFCLPCQFFFLPWFFFFFTQNKGEGGGTLSWSATEYKKSSLYKRSELHIQLHFFLRTQTSNFYPLWTMHNLLPISSKLGFTHLLKHVLLQHFFPG